MSDDTARTALAALKEDLKTALAEYETAANRVNSLRRAVDALAQLVGESTEGVGDLVPKPSVEALRAEGIYPSLKQAVAALIREEPGTWTAKRLVDEVKRRDWLDPAVQNVGHAIRSAAGRLVAEGSLRKVAPGVYSSAES